MKASLKGRYENIKDSAKASLNADTNVGDVKLKASFADVAVVHGLTLPSFLSFSLEKPGSLSIESSPQKDVKFKFMNSMKVLEKAVDLTYTHARGEKRTEVDGAIALDAGKKVAVSHVLGTKEWKVRYTYAIGALQRTVIEPCYDVKANAWDVAVMRKLERGDAVKASYQPSSHVLGLQWTGGSRVSTTVKISASINIAEKKAAPKLSSTWTYDI